MYQFSWSLVSINNIISKFLNVCSLIALLLLGVGRWGSRKLVNHTSWVALVTPTLFEFSFGILAFVIGLGQISFLFSWSLKIEKERTRHYLLQDLL